MNKRQEDRKTGRQQISEFVFTIVLNPLSLRDRGFSQEKIPTSWLPVFLSSCPTLTTTVFCSEQNSPTIVGSARLIVLVKST